MTPKVVNIGQKMISNIVAGKATVRTNPESDAVLGEEVGTAFMFEGYVGGYISVSGPASALVGDYGVHMISMRAISQEDLRKMDSDLKYVLGIAQYERYTQENREFFSRALKSAVDVIDACTNIKRFRDYLQYEVNQGTGEEKTDVCKASDEIEREAPGRGRKQGIKEGEKRGERRGILITLFFLVNDDCLKRKRLQRGQDYQGKPLMHK